MEFVARYRVLREVARGGVGLVLEAEDADGRRVGIKLLQAGRAANAAQRGRFGVEVRSLLRLDHPGVVRILDAGEECGSLFLVTEWIEGESLEDRLRREGPLDARAAAELIRRVAVALDHCHAAGILHRDLKPGNVLIRESDGAPLLTDFGLALDLEAAIDASRHTVEGQPLGTPTYWSPEQAGGRLEAIDSRSDVFGLGGLLFACLTARPPHAGANLVDMFQALSTPPTPPSAFSPGIPPALDELCLRLLARSPSDRPPSAAAVASELASWARPPARRLARAVVGLAALASLLGALAALLGRPVRPGPSETDLVPGGRSTGADFADAPTDAQGWIACGLEHRRRGDHDGALAAFDRALALEPCHVQALIERASTRMGTDLPGSRADLDRAVELAPDSARRNVSTGLRHQHGGITEVHQPSPRRLQVD